MDIAEHKKNFEKIIKKYHLNDDEKANEIASFLTKKTQNTVSAKEFAQLFVMDEKEAIIFLSYIERGIKFKEEHIDGKS